MSVQFTRPVQWYILPQYDTLHNNKTGRVLPRVWLVSSEVCTADKKIWGFNGNWTHDLRDTSAMLYQLSYEASLEAGQDLVHFIPLHCMISYMKRVRWCVYDIDNNNYNAFVLQKPDIGVELTGGCRGYATKLMEWPEELIVGGVKKNKSGTIRRYRD